MFGRFHHSFFCGAVRWPKSWQTAHSAALKQLKVHGGHAGCIASAVASGAILSTTGSRMCEWRKSHCESRSADGNMNIINVYYLKPFEDELTLLGAVCQNNPKINFSWGNALPKNSSVRNDIHVLITRIPSGGELDALAGLRSLLVPFAGPVASTKELVRERPYLSLHTCHSNSASTAELALALLFAAVKRIAKADADMRSDIKDGRPWKPGWRDLNRDTQKLAGCTAVVLGYGAIGGRVATVLSALGMKVHVIRRNVPMDRPGTASSTISIHQISELPELLSQASVLMVCLPGTASTLGLIGEAEIRAMPKGAVLVNVGRGRIVDEDALFKALEDGHLSAAGLDVWYNYPTDPVLGDQKHLWPSIKPFHELGNRIIMSPHCGQNSYTKAQDTVEELERMLNVLSDTGSLPNQYNIDEGY